MAQFNTCHLASGDIHFAVAGFQGHQLEPPETFFNLSLFWALSDEPAAPVCPQQSNSTEVAI